MEGQHFAPLVPEWEDEVAERSAEFETQVAIQFFPNPASTWIQYVFNHSVPGDNWSIECLDALGKLVMLVGVPKGNQTGVIELGSLNPGFYIFRVLQGDRIQAGQSVFIQN
jgi:hypothetical protein